MQNRYPKLSIKIATILLLSFTQLSAQKYPNLAPTPPMGWNSWNYFVCHINEKKVMRMADAMARSGMKDAGYRYIVIDDCWQTARDTGGYIIADPRKFPHGIKWLADYIHAKGLKFGIYSDAGTRTCQGRPGSAGYEAKDAQRYAEWGVDYLKYDYCNTEGMVPQVQYSAMRDALYRTGRPIVFSLCDGGKSKPWLWADTVGHLRRTTDDIQNKFATGHGVLKIFDEQSLIRIYNKPGSWNDPDMLQSGNIGLTFIQSRTHFTLWCMMSAPLIAGNNLRLMDQRILKVLTNKNAISIDQDKLGIPCFLWAKTASGIEAWIKPLSDGGLAVCFLNRNTMAASLDFNWQQVARDPDFKKSYTIDGSYSIYDIWHNKDLGTTAKNMTTKVKGQDVLFVVLKKK
jgi:alpha-galactosidase